VILPSVSVGAFATFGLARITSALGMRRLTGGTLAGALVAVLAGVFFVVTIFKQIS